MSYPPRLTANVNGSFAYLTVKDRMPVIVTNIIDDLCRRKYEFLNLYGQESTIELKNVIGKLSELKNEIQTDKTLREIDLSSNSCNDDKYWQAYFDDYITKIGDPQWFSAPWLFVECYMYRKIHDIFRTNKCFSSCDPFEQLKLKTMADYKPFLVSLLKYTNNILSSTSTEPDLLQNYIQTLTQISIWGNQCDLSISTTESLKEVESIEVTINSKTSNLLVWDFNYFWNFLRLMQCKQTKLGIVLDNAGVELICDLCLMTVLMKFNFFSAVTFYPKIRPYFVSDTTRNDLEYIFENIGSFSPEANVLSQLWNSYLKQGDWTIAEEPFWTAPQDYAELAHCDPRLYEELSLHSLVIFKGDLNYRKLTGDYDWPHDTSFKTSLRGFVPTNLLVLRTVKGGPVTGLDEKNPNVIAAKLKKNFGYSGAYGMAHFVNSEQ